MIGLCRGYRVHILKEQGLGYVNSPYNLSFNNSLADTTVVNTTDIYINDINITERKNLYHLEGK